MIQRWISDLIYFQFIIVSAIVLYTLGLLLLRRFIDRYRNQRVIEYSGYLADQLSRDPEVAASLAPVVSKSIKRMVLLAQIKLMRGDERALLIRMYRKNGFLEKDKAHSNAFTSRRRLEGITAMASLGLPELASHFYQKLNDSNPLVATVALLALSEQDHPLNSRNLFLQLPKRLKRELSLRSNAMNEFVANLATIHGIDPLVEIMTHETESKLIQSSIHALRHLQTADSSTALKTILQKKTELQPGIVSDIIQALRKIGDPSAADVVRPFLKSDSSIVRAQSVAFLLSIEDGESASEIDMLTRKPDVEMKRLLLRLDLQFLRKA
jgi:HEAT repeat protein